MVRITEALNQMATDCHRFNQPLPVVKLPAVACYALARSIESDLGAHLYQHGKGGIMFCGIEFRYDDKQSMPGEWYV